MSDQTAKKPVRHLLGLSGGKDSSALAIYMRDRVPEMEYFFSDTGAELPETLQFIDLLQDYLAGIDLLEIKGRIEAALQQVLSGAISRINDLVHFIDLRLADYKLRDDLILHAPGLGANSNSARGASVCR